MLSKEYLEKALMTPEELSIIGLDFIKEKVNEIIKSHLEALALLAEKEKKIEILQKQVTAFSADCGRFIKEIGEKEKEIEVYKKESAGKNQLINQYKDEIAMVNITLNRVKLCYTVTLKEHAKSGCFKCSQELAELEEK